MKFAELARLVTGFSTPIFGVQWNPPEAEVTTARRVLAFLEDRRVLYADYELEVPAHCIQSVLRVREHLTAEIGRPALTEEMRSSLRAMRGACRKFLDRVQVLQSRDMLPDVIAGQGHLGTWIFCSALGELRGVIGQQIVVIAVLNGLDVEGGLERLLPGEDSDDYDATATLPW